MNAKIMLVIAGIFALSGTAMLVTMFYIGESYNENPTVVTAKYGRYTAEHGRYFDNKVTVVSIDGHKYVANHQGGVCHAESCECKQEKK